MREMSFIQNDHELKGKWKFWLATFGLMTILADIIYVQRAELRNNQFAQTEILYNQDQPADLRLINTIQNAHRYIYFVIYTATKENIIDALIAAKLRGLDVRGVMDYSQSIISQEKPLIAKMRKYDIPLEIPFKKDGITHMKMLVTDNSYAVGSYNWTVSATSYNDEVLEIGTVESFRLRYLQIFYEVWKRYQ